MLARTVAAVLFFAATALSQGTAWAPGSTYDSRVPTPQSVFGYEIGEYYTEHLQMTDYMRRLESASSRVKVFSVGRTNERRELILVAISDPANIQKLEAHRLAVEELRDPRKTSEGRAREISRTTPAIAWMNFANDGNETAAFEAGIQLTYQLAAGQDADTLRILKETITILYPAHNPESHSRHVVWMKASAMRNPDPAAQEHRGDWRMDTNNNHYQIDLNRDAVFQSQVESRIIVGELHRWNPVVFVDHHGNPDRFFFPPWARPVNPQVSPESHKWVEAYGRAIAAAFDRNGWNYFTRNVFDLHYPGYYDSYPTLNGATGMTFETDGGGNKGLAYELPDGRVTTLRDGTLHHFTGAWASLLTTAVNRTERLMALYQFRASALKEADGEAAKQVVLVPGRDPARAADLVELLLRHRIEVHRIRVPFQSASAREYLSASPDQVQKKNFPAGSYVIFAKQPQKRLLRTLLDRETPLEPAFLDQVNKAHEYNRGLKPGAPRKDYGFYDINAWCLPLAYGVEAWWTEETAPAVDPVTARPEIHYSRPAKAGFAYLFDWSSLGATRLVNALWSEGFRISLAREEFTLAGRAFPKGTVVIRLQSNPESVHARLPELAAANEVEVTAAQTAMADAGKDLGDASVVDLEKPSIAIVTEMPTSATAYGAIWYLLEKQYGVPFTAIRGIDLMSVDLRRYNVIVLPDGTEEGYSRFLGEQGAERLKRWVQDGGSLVCIKGATVWAAGPKVNLTGARDKFAEPAEPAKPGEKKEEVVRMEAIPGAFVRLKVDTEHHLALGIDPHVVALFRSATVFLPPTRGAMVARIDSASPLVAGFAFKDSQAAIPGGLFLWDESVGRGHVICLADDVAFRTFLHGAHRLLLNPILLAPTRWQSRD